jgi:vancomycin resistance protein VanW
MAYQAIPTPQRSQLRLWLGRYFHILKRHLVWINGKQSFATTRQTEQLPVEIFTHQSLLIRPLKDIDMALQYNKVTNLKLALNCLNGIVIQPGEIFSFWYLVGNPSKNRGFQLGMTLVNGQVRPGYGGGLCQLSNLIYWMALHSPLTVKERWRHSYDVFPDINRTLPFGSGATVSYNYIDLQLENQTKHPYQINLWLTDEYLCGAIYGAIANTYQYEILEKNHQITGPITGKYMRHNQLIRQSCCPITQQIVEEELVAENHALMMYAPLLNASWAE